jgi:hypothetical protein
MPTRKTTMKSLILTFISLASLLLLPGCLQSETTIRLNKDGTGTITEETTLGEKMLAMLEQMSAQAGANAPDPTKEMFSDDKAKARAARLGEGVTFEKSEIINADGKKGGRITYRFADINKLKISPGDGIGDMAPGNQAPPEGVEATPLGFIFADGKLTITTPEPKAPDKAPELPEQAAAPEMMAAMKEIFADMKVSVRLVCEPGIAETNATYHEGDTITLTEMNMGELMQDDGAFEKFIKLARENPNKVAEALKGVKGMKVETQREVTVKLK